MRTILISALLMLLRCASSSVLVADFRMARMIELSARPPYCKIHSDRGDIQRMLLASDVKKVRQVPRESVNALEEVCKEANGLSGELQGGLTFIYPGTKWCGPGSIAKNSTDVGRYADEDRCCREHDLCPNTLLPGQCQRGLCNRGSFTRSHCDCDARFRKCLQNLNTEIANTLGAVFFNVVQVTCFDERRPCSHWQRAYNNNYYQYGQMQQTKCPLEFFPSASYAPSYTSNHYASNTISRSFNTNPYYQEKALKKESFGIISRNVINDYVIRPFSGFLKFFVTAKSIVLG